jgi:hypothetical protein
LADPDRGARSTIGQKEPPMSLFGGNAGGGGLFSRTAEATLQNPPAPPARPAYTPRDGAADQAQHVAAQIGPAEKALEFGFRGRGGQPPADVTGPGAPRDGAGVR